ncbi:MAG: hypothetical protein IJF84_12240 [Thermoguttaceae bacterium]|nr:hypothetical protein [Thermoguttaceae bacterium]
MKDKPTRLKPNRLTKLQKTPIVRPPKRTTKGAIFSPIQNPHSGIIPIFDFLSTYPKAFSLDLVKNISNFLFDKGAFCPQQHLFASLLD